MLIISNKKRLLLKLDALLVKWAFRSDQDFSV